MPNHPNVIIAATSSVVAAGIAYRISGVCHEQGVHLSAGSSRVRLKAGASSLPANSGVTFEDKSELFSLLDSLGPLTLADTMLVIHLGVDYEECFQATVSTRHSPWHSERLNDQGIALELVLRYPQLFPVFLIPPSGGLEQWLEVWLARAAFSDARMLSHWQNMHFVDLVDDDRVMKQLIRRFSLGLRTYFDPTGLRTLVRNTFLGLVFGGPEDWHSSKQARATLNRRLDNLAVSIDEENDISLVVAYAAYKFGWRSWPISTYELLVSLQEPNWNDPNSASLVVVRDLDLRFRDYPAISGDDKQHSLRHALRNIYSDEWSQINLPAHCRVRVLSHDAKVLREPRGASGEGIRLGQEPGAVLAYYGLSKPFSSIYALAELFGKETLSLISGLTRAVDEDMSTPHGAPYQNLRIARELLEQASKSRANKELNSCIIAALLAQESYSLLLGMSETSTLEALREIHLAEARAEGEFAGISHGVLIEGRRRDLEHTIKNLGLVDGGENFLARVWAELRLVYKECEQFDASEDSNAESLVHSRWFPRFSRGVSVGRLEPVRTGGKRILVAAVVSPWRLLVLAAAWTFLLTVLHCAVYKWTLAPNFAGLVSFVDLWRHIVTDIIRPEMLNVHGIHPEEDETVIKAALDLLMSCTSLLFVGLIVTVVFRKTTRG